MLNFKNAKHAKKNFVVLTIVAVAIFALTAVSFAATNFNDKANAEPLSPQDCENASFKASETETDLMKCYEAFGHAYNNELNFVNISNIISGECLAGGASTDSDKVKVLDTFDKNSAVDKTDVLLEQWNDYYDAIHECNVFLEKYDKRSDKTKKEDIPYIAEAYALRGICYFDLVRLFENIPLVTTPNGYMSQQANVDDVYKQIFADLLYAGQNAPVYSKDAEDNNVTNRITKYAADAYLGRVYLYQRDLYNKLNIGDLPYPSPMSYIDQNVAARYVKDCVDNSRIDLVFDCRNLFASSCATLRRVNDGIVAADGDLDVLLYSFDGQEQYSEGEYMFTIKNNCETLSESNNWIGKLGIYGSHQRVRGNGGGMLSVPQNFKEYLYKLERFDNNDPRKDAFVTYSYLDDEVKTDPATWDDAIQGWRDCTGFINSKYSPLCYESGLKAEYNQPLVLVRFTDALLMLSELTGDAQYINRVRARAGLAPAPYDISYVKYEREMEFMFEGINYWDDLRWGKAAQKFEYLQNGYEVCNNGQWQFIKGYDINNYKSKRFLPIPESVVAKYGYRQNAGW